jgi:hypothetical protein
MKNLITFLLYCLSITVVIGQAAGQTRIDVNSRTSTETIFRISLTGVNKTAVKTPAGDAFIVSMDKGTQLLKAGAPDLPKYALSLMIPASGNMAIDILDSEYQDFQDVSVAPSKGNLKRNVDPSTVPYKFGPEYQQDQFYPGALSGLQQPFVMRDVRGQGVWIYPVQYNPVTRVLRVYTSMTVKVYHAGGKGINELKTYPGRSVSPAFKQIYQRLFLNYDAKYFGQARTQQAPERMLVIAKDQYLTDLEPLIAWKRQSGIYTDVLPTSQTGTDPASIANVVKDYYDQYGITYLLLVGDEVAVNPYVRQDAGTDYACDNCLGYLAGDDHLPEVLVGRFNAATEAQLKIMVNRNLEYEKSPLVDVAQNWCATGMASTSNLGQGIGDDGQADYEQGNEWKTKHLADGFEKIWEFYDGDHADISPTPGDVSADQAGDPVNTDLIQLMNTRGVTLYNYCGHGYEQGLVSGNFNTTAVGTLRNNHRYPTIIAVACCAGNFTNNSGGDCLGEAVQRAGNPATGEAWGSIAGFFSSDFQSWAPPMSGQDGMNQYLIDADGVTLTPRFSAMLAAGNAAMIAEWGPDGEIMADFWNPFVEPSTMPRTRLPLPLVATHDSGLFLGSTNLTVQCPVEGALISLYWGGQTLAVATVSGGFAALTFPPLANIGDLVVTGTQFNYIPYQGNVAVTPSSGPFVVNQLLEINDTYTGNNNQKADFGETVQFNLTLGNVGLSSASAATATLSSVDNNVVVIDGFESFGDLDVNATLAKPAAFTFTVNDDVQNGHIVNFTLHIAFGTQGYDLIVPVKLQAPNLKIGTFQLSDQIGGNNDHHIQSGETISIVVQNLNVGASVSPNGLGTLTTDSPWLTIGPAVQLGPINALTGTANAVFSVTVNPNTPQVSIAHFHYTTKAGNYAAEQDFGPFTINPIIETFETQDYSGYPWQMSGNKPWVITNSGPYTGAYCSRSGTISNSQTSVMSMNLNFAVDGTVSFARKVSSEQDYDFLRFKIDGVEIDHWSGNIGWGEVSYQVAAGVHTLTWVYDKDDIGSSGSDHAWVDDISLPPFAVVVATQNPNPDRFRVTAGPNPTGSKTRILITDVPGAQRLDVKLYDCLGHLVLISDPSNVVRGSDYQVELDLQHLPAGLYFAQVQGEKQTELIKLIKN